MNYVEMFITALIALALFGPLQDFVDGVNATGATKTLISLVPLLYIVILVAAFAYAVKKQAGR